MIDLTEVKMKEVKKPTISPVAVEMWKTIIQHLFYGHFNYKHVIIPVIEYMPNTDSDDGTISRHKSITVNYDNVEKTLESYVIEDECEVALSKNIMLIEKGKKARLITLDIIDVDNKYTQDDILKYTNNYHIVKTRHSYHLYPKLNPNDLLQSTGSVTKDKYWLQEYIRVTESDTKGPITKLE